MEYWLLLIMFQLGSAPLVFVKNFQSLIECQVLNVMMLREAKIVEGYPSKPGKDGKYIASFSWTGTRSLFYKMGFEVVGNSDGGKQRVRKEI